MSEDEVAAADSDLVTAGASSDVTSGILSNSYILTTTGETSFYYSSRP